MSARYSALRSVSPATSLRSLSQLLAQEASSRPEGAPQEWRNPVPAAATPSYTEKLQLQLQQLATDFKYNLKLIEERDLELERLESAAAVLRQALASKESAFSDAQAQLARNEGQLQTAEAKLAAAEQQHVAALAAAARQAEEAEQRLAAMLESTSSDRAEAAADFERQLLAVQANERAALNHAQRAQLEGDQARLLVAQLEEQLADQDAGMQRIAAQFQDALSALQQLEARCDALAAREADLESEVGATREAANASDRARVNSEDQLSKERARRERSDLEVVRLSQRSERAEQELQSLKAQLAQLQQSLLREATMRAEAQAEAAREHSAREHAQSCLEAERLSLEAARREAASAAQRLERAEEQRARDAKQLAVAESQARAAEEEARALQSDLDDVSAHRQNQESAELAAARAEIERLEHALDTCSEQLEQAQREGDMLRLRAEHEQLRGRVARPTEQLPPHDVFDDLPLSPGVAAGARPHRRGYPSLPDLDATMRGARQQQLDAIEPIGGLRRPLGLAGKRGAPSFGGEPGIPAYQGMAASFAGLHAADAAGAADDGDPLLQARQLIQAAKSHLRQVAEAGGRATQAGGQ